MTRLYSNRRFQASLRCACAAAAAAALALLGCAGASPPSLPSGAATDQDWPPTAPAHTPSPAPRPVNPTAEAGATRPPRPAVAPRLPTVAIPDPDRTTWPGPIRRFQATAVVEDADLAGPLIGFHLTRGEVTFRVHYLPGEARYIREWALDLSRSGLAPLLVFPAGFFTADNLALGLMVSDDYYYSGPYGFGGIFAVQGGEPDIRWIEPRPIQPDETFEQAVQAFPVYVSRGLIPPLTEHENRAPRTVIVETHGGDFVVLLSLTSLFRTIELAQWLVDSDLDVYNALNLDGGRSAGYWAGEADYVDSYVPLPAVIAAYAK